GLPAESLAHRHLLHGDAGLPASLQEVGDVGLVVPGGDHEKAAGVLETVRHDAAQDPVLLDAFDGGFGVLDDVATPRMEEAVEAAARPVGDVPLLDEDGVEPPHHQIAEDAGPGGPASDHQYLGLVPLHTGDTR